MTIKTAFLTMLFNDTFYIIDSEPALHRTYADGSTSLTTSLTMILRPEMRRFQLLDIVLEFKFLKLSEVDQSGVAVRAMENTVLVALKEVQAKIQEATLQLQRYRKTLVKKYGDRLHLRTYAVVAIGFERLIWTEV